MKILEIIRDNATFNLVYFLVTLLIAFVYVLSVLLRYIRKRTSKTYVSELTKMMKSKEK